MVVRDDQALRKTGEMAQLPEDFSPFQIGSEGTFRGIRFGIVGRMKIGWQDGVWNEWFIVSDDGRKGWLAEAQGFYSPCFETKELNRECRFLIEEKLSRKQAERSRLWKNVPLGSTLRINDNWYRVVDVKEAHCIGAEGELPFDTPKGRKSVTIDLLRGSGDFASIDVATEGIAVFEGAYVGWNNLKCKYYRTFEGW